MTNDQELPTNGHYISLPDPCPHIARLDLISAKLAGGTGLDALLSHLDHCPGAH